MTVKDFFELWPVCFPALLKETNIETAVVASSRGSINKENSFSSYYQQNDATDALYGIAYAK